MLPTESAPLATDPPVLPSQTGGGLNQLEAFVSALTRKRDAAVNGRKSSGIEADWLEDEEFFQGIDDANRQFVRSWVATVKRGIPAQQLPESSRSTVFLNITRPYCETAAARLGDMLLPVDERCWEIKPTPIAEIDGETMGQLQAAGLSPEKMQEIQKQVQAEAEKAAELMGDEIDDHLVECQWHGEVRNVIEDAARIGCGVLKGPVPQKHVYKRWVSDAGPPGVTPLEKLWGLVRRTIRKWVFGGSGMTLEVVTEIKPGSKRIDPWNFFPDPACGESIHNGQFTWEREYVTPKQLMDMTDLPGYSKVQIAEILKEGPKQLTSREASDGTYVPVVGQYEMWTFYGVVAQQDAVATGLRQPDGQTPLTNAMALLVNDKLIKVEVNVLDTGAYPYDVFAWQRRAGVPWGMGVARHIRTPQRMLNAAVRATMDNGGMIAAPQIVIGSGITPQDGVMEVRGRKLWLADTTVVDVTKSFFCWIPDAHIEDFERIIALARDVAEQSTGMPMLLQGQQTQGQGASTLGGMQLLQNNASGTLRRLAKRFDDSLSEPHIRRYYDWLMQYSPREDIKGDFQVDARGSSSLVERDSQKQFLFAALNFSKDPAFGINPYNLFKELAISDRMDPKKLQYDEKDYEARVGKPSALEEAKTALAQAQAANETAKGVLASVQALFSAVMTVSTVASNPALAPAADATAKSAGFVDKDAPPAIGTPAAGAALPTPAPAAAVIAPENTHPTLPPTPRLPSAEVGAARGIEGGKT